jgi:hypothetical protein
MPAARWSHSLAALLKSEIELDADHRGGRAGD